MLIGRLDRYVLDEMTLEEVKSLKGVGDAIGKKVMELQQTGKMEMLKNYKTEVLPYR